MGGNTNPARRAMIAKIKIAQKELGMDDDTYRAVLMRAAGKNSCTQMSDGQLEAVLREMQRLGFAPRQSAYVRPPLHLADHGGLIRKIGALLAQTGKTWAYADGMARNMFGEDRANRLDGDRLHRLMTALQIYANRRAGAKK